MPFLTLPSSFWNPKTRENTSSKPLKTHFWIKNMCAYFWENFTYFLIFYQLVTCLAMLCLDGHKIPQNILKPYFYSVLWFSKKTCFFLLFLPNWCFWKPSFFTLAKQRQILDKILITGCKPQKHKTQTFALNIKWNHHKKGYIILVQNLTFKLVQSRTFKTPIIGPEPNFYRYIYIYIHTHCRVKIGSKVWAFWVNI